MAIFPAMASPLPRWSRNDMPSLAQVLAMPRMASAARPTNCRSLLVKWEPPQPCRRSRWSAHADGVGLQLGAAVPTTHKVRSGETLWSISKQHLGAGHLWPSIYIHNNSPEVVRRRGKRRVNPNLIHPGDIIYLPPTGHGVPRPRISALPPRSAAAPAPMASAIAPSNRRDPATPSSQINPAGQVMVPEAAVKYVFPDQVLYTSEVPGWKITAKLAGASSASTRSSPTT